MIYFGIKDGIDPSIFTLHDRFLFDNSNGNDDSTNERNSIFK
jgi:hypothetical protein